MEKLNIIVGPNLKNDADHSTEEKDFLATKNDNFSDELPKSFPDFVCENEKSKEITSTKKLTDHTCEHISRKHNLYLVNYSNNAVNSSYTEQNAERKERKRKSGKLKEKTINLLNIFKNAKTLAKKIRKTLYFQNYKNMTNVHKKILNDVSVFPEDQNKFQSKVRFY